MALPTEQYRGLIDIVCKETPPVPATVLEAMVLTESNGNPDAHSASDARGLCQLIPRWHNDGVGKTVAALMGRPLTDMLWYDPEFSLRCGAAHLRWCYTSDGSQSWTRAVRAYFSGVADPPPGFVDGQDTSPEQHIARFEAALAIVSTYRIGGSTVALKPYRFVGLDKDVWLPEWIVVEKKIITHERFRSFLPYSGQVKTTWHDTGNPNTNALQEWTWANNGREGAGVGGYSFIFDDTRIIQAQPLNEVTWAAGTPEGNKVSWHAEQAWGGTVGFAKSLEVGAALHGGLIAAKGWSTDTALVKHQYWYGKWCPGQILNKGIWSQVVKMVSDAAALARLAATGGVVAGLPATYVKPVPVPELAPFQKVHADTVPAIVVGADKTRYYFVNDRVKARVITPRRQKGYIDSLVVGPNIKVGEEFEVDWLFTADDDRDYYLTPWYTRVLMADTVRVADTISVENAP